jgi:hypothetical protein
MLLALSCGNGELLQMAREFRTTEARDFTIVEDGKVIGTIRVKPSAIMWKGPNARGDWHGVKPENFGAFVTKSGKKMKK